MDLDGKVAIVTGGAAGLGRGIVDAFVAAGARVVIADIDAERGANTVAEIGNEAIFRRCDVSIANDVQHAVDSAVEQFGALDIMVNNAGIGGAPVRFLDDDFADFERGMAVNVLGVMLGTQRAARQMKAQRLAHPEDDAGGAIVNVTSIGGINAGAGVTAYRAAKAGVVHLTKCFAIELARYQIRVNAIAPAHIPTAINTAYDQSAIIREMQPLQRQGSPVDVGEAARFLASDRAAQITGIVMPVDGGTTAGRPVPNLRRSQ